MEGKKSLAPVMPVYNENACIAESISDWLQVLDTLGLDFYFFILDDGSTDGTHKTLAKFQSDARIKISRHSNRGHGPTILEGYLRACRWAKWVFQTDSDLEIGASNFTKFWAIRDDYDAAFGIRINHRQGIARQAITLLSRWSVRCIYAPGPKDVNIPYRLMRCDLLKSVIAELPPDTFAPNIIISGALALWKAHILDIPVPFTQRKTGSTSLQSLRLARGVCKSFLQLVKLRRRFGLNSPISLP